jgi:hypothetical protein
LIQDCRGSNGLRQIAALEISHHCSRVRDPSGQKHYVNDGMPDSEATSGTAEAVSRRIRH